MSNNTPEAMSEKQVIERMMIDVSNKITEGKVNLRLMNRRNVKGLLNQQQQLELGKMQDTQKRLEDALADLQEFFKEASDTSPLAEIFASAKL